MKTKLILLTIASFGIALIAKSQTSDEEADAIITLLGVQKKDAVRQMVAIEPKDSVAFWKVYDEYQKQNKATAKNRLKLYERTANSYSNLTPSIADSLANQYLVNRIGQEKTLEEYYKKMKAATNSVTAFQFYQAEVYLLTQLRANIMSQIPTYGQLVQAAKKSQ